VKSVGRRAASGDAPSSMARGGEGGGAEDPGAVVRAEWLARGAVGEVDHDQREEDDEGRVTGDHPQGERRADHARADQQCEEW